jgi:hypothetical protein
MKVLTFFCLTPFRQKSLNRLRNGSPGRFRFPACLFVDFYFTLSRVEDFLPLMIDLPVHKQEVLTSDNFGI